MNDEKLLTLFFSRDESAIERASEKYGRYLKSIAYSVLRSEADAEECVNEALFSAWQSIPPARPNAFAAYLGKIVRNAALNAYERESAQKRGGAEMALILDEIGELASGGEISESVAFADALSRFLGTLNAKTRKIFVRRYWYAENIAEIARAFSMSESAVKMSLLRTRESLRSFLEKEGINL